MATYAFGSASLPETRLSLRVRYRDHYHPLNFLAEYHSERIASHQVESMPVIARWKSFRFLSNGLKSSFKLCLKPFGSRNAPFRIPGQRFCEIVLRC